MIEVVGDSMLEEKLLHVKQELTKLVTDRFVTETLSKTMISLIKLEIDNLEKEITKLTT